MADFPEQRTIGLGMDILFRQVRRFGRSSAIGTMTRGAPLVKYLAPAGDEVHSASDRIRSRGGGGGCNPVGIAFPRLSAERYGGNQQDERDQTASTRAHYFALSETS